MGKTIAVSNLKGGVGKTMTAASLGVGLARQGKRVLCLDSDAQHSLTDTRLDRQIEHTENRKRGVCLQNGKSLRYGV